MSKTQRACGQSGMILPIILVLLAIFFVFATSIMSWALQGRRGVVTKARDTKALQVAESGINYYKWHLAHFEDDYRDANTWCCIVDGVSYSAPASCGGACGPYIKDYFDYEGKKVGEYSLKITPPLVGSTIVGIESKGKISEDSRTEKTVTARLGKKSLARYSLLVNANIWVGSTSDIYGPLHSNGGIRFDGTCNAEVTSGVDNYNATSYSGDIDEEGIWSPSPVAECKKNWLFAVPKIDFSLFSVDMSKIKEKAKSPVGSPEGYFLPYTGESGFKGYQLIFNDNKTVTILIVKTFSEKIKYQADNGTWQFDYEKLAATKPYKSGTNTTGIYPMPANGLIFVEDNVWVEGTVNGRATVAVSNPAEISEYPRIIINGDIFYHKKANGERDETCVLGLMAKGDIILPKHIPAEINSTLNIDAVMLSQTGHVRRRAYNGPRPEDLLKIYGGVISYLSSGWAWYFSDGSFYDGFRSRETVYDNHLTFGPPPSFPTEGNFEVLSWSEK